MNTLSETKILVVGTFLPPAAGQSQRGTPVPAFRGTARRPLDYASPLEAALEIKAGATSS